MSRKLKSIILGIFDKHQHNRQYMRLISRYLPGTLLKDWTPKNAAKYGHLYIVQYFIKTNIICTKNEDYNSANEQYIRISAENGHLSILEYLWKFRTDKNTFNYWSLMPGASACMSINNEIASNGHLNILKFLQQKGVKYISCTANAAAGNGHLNIVQYLRDNNVHCDFYGADSAAIQGHLHILQDLYKYGIQCTSTSLNIVKRKNNQEIVQFLEEHGIIPQN